MTNLAVSFRIDSVTHGYTYGERYSTLVEQIRKTKVWEETTSFALVETTESADQFATRLYLESRFTADHDLLLVIDLATGRGVTYGTPEYPATLRSMLFGLTQK